MGVLRLKVLMVCPYAEDGGGISRWTKNILDYYHTLEDCDVNIKLLNTCRSVSIIDNQSRIKYYWRSIIDYSKVIWSFYRIVKKEHFDVVHIATTAGLGLLRDEIILRITRHHKIKSFLHYHFGKIPTMDVVAPRMWYYFNKVSPKANGIIVLDELSKEKLEQEGYNKVYCLPNPLSKETQSLIINAGETKRKQRSVLFVGHCVRSKGVLELIEACRTIQKVNLTLIGETDNEIEAYLNKYKDTQWLHVKGVMPYDRVIIQMLECDVFVLPSYSEGFPNVIIEAMACGCAIVATSVGAIPQMLKDKDGDYGLLIPPQDTKILASTLNKLILDEEHKAHLREGAKIKVNQDYYITSIWNKIVDIWKS